MEREVHSATHAKPDQAAEKMSNQGSNKQQRVEMTPQQCRAARQLCGMKQKELADKSGVSLATIKVFEAQGKPILPKTTRALAAALNKEGVSFDFFATPEGNVTIGVNIELSRPIN